MKQVKMNSKKFIAVFTAVCMLLTFMPMSVTAEEAETVTESAANPPVFQDVIGHWGQAAIEKWSGYGIISGYNGQFRPDDAITRGEMAVILDNLMDYQVAGNNGFSDLASGKFYTDAILKANASGIIKGDGATVRPLDKITREEAAVMMSRAFAVDGKAGATGFADDNAISTWAKEAVSGMETKGFVSGYAGKFDPKASITRAAAVTMINNIVKAYYTTAGTYTENVEGTAIIKVSDVILKGVTVSGNLIIAEGVGKGDATLDNVTVKGETVVRGGGENSIHIIGNSSITSIRIEKIGDKLRIVVAEGTEVKEVEVAAGEEIVITGTVGKLELSASDAVVYATAAEITTANITGEGSTIIVGAQSTINSIIVSSTASNTTVQAETGAVVKEVEASAPVNVSGTGTVTTVSLEAGASGSTVTTPKTTVPVAEGVTGVTGTGGTTLPAGSTATNGTTPTAPATTGTTPPVPSGGGGGGGSNTVFVSDISVNKTTTTLKAGATEQLTATVSPENATNKTVTWSTSNADIATVDNGVVTAHAEGTAIITVTTQDGNKTANFEVKVISFFEDFSKGNNFVFAPNGDAEVVDNADGTISVKPTNDSTHGAFTKFGSYSSEWPIGGYITKVKVYIDPDTMNTGHGFTWSSGINNQAGTFLSEQLTHIRKIGDVVKIGNRGGVANTQEDQYTEDTIPEAGHYTIQTRYYEAEGIVKAELKVIDENDVAIHTSQPVVLKNSPENVLSDITVSEAGGNRYGWFTYINMGEAGVIVDEISLMK